MKKMLLLAIIAASCLICCEKPSLTIDVQTGSRLEKISDDKLFEEMIRENYRMFTNTRDIELLINYLSDDVISKNEEDNIHLIFGYPDKISYINDLEKQKNRILELNKRYNFESVPKDKLRTEIVKTFENLGLYQLDQTSVMALSNCESIRRNCIVKVAAEATGIHIGCTVLDISVFAGIACHAAAVVYQWTAGNNCNLEAENCSKAGRRLETNTRINR